MVRSSKILEEFLAGLDLMKDIEGVSLYLPSEGGGGEDSLLFQRGEVAVAELQDEETAAKTHQRDGGRRADRMQPSIRVFPSHSADARLFRVVAEPARGESLPSGLERREDSSEIQLRQGCVVWIGLAFRTGTCPFASEEHALESPGEDVPANDAFAWWSWIVTFAGNLARHLQEVSGVLNDPVTGVAGRAQLQGHLSREVARAHLEQTPLSLLLVSPDDFALVNQRFGHQAGDGVLREIASQVSASLRKNDFAARYGGAIFAIALPGANLRAARAVGQKLLGGLQGRSFSMGSIQLRFRVGLVTWDPTGDEQLSSLDLTSRAEIALFHSRRPGQTPLVAWQRELETIDTGSDIGGFFTGNMAKDYRNMQLLADVVTVVAGSSGFHDLAKEAVTRLSESLKPDRLALFEWSEDLGLSLIKGVERDGTEMESSRLDGRLGLLEEAIKNSRPLVSQEPAPGSDPVIQRCAIPMLVGKDALGGLYFEGGGEFTIEGTDLIFLRSLASQMAVALDRARLSLQEKRRQDQERTRLKAEVEGLRQAVEESNLEYRSEHMEAIMSTVRRVAPTDATVLVTGESGTGKDVVARTLHKLGKRSKKPLVVVDCAAIPATLIESELFGHEKGAFSGAGQKRIGRLEQADGATVFLDEIGELPLEVQSKLLRFVQEKQLTPVGSSRTRSVDVRLLAATNRELLTEVRAGRFREDLYYRLNVVRLSLPPLRERPDDVLHLGYHYLRTYSLMYSKEVSLFSAEAEAKLLSYQWPGNIRELQNRVQQAVILGDGPEIGLEALKLDEPGASRDPRSQSQGFSVPRSPAHFSGEFSEGRPQPSERAQHPAPNSQDRSHPGPNSFSPDRGVSGPSDQTSGAPGSGLASAVPGHRNESTASTRSSSNDNLPGWGGSSMEIDVPCSEALQRLRELVCGYSVTVNERGLPPIPLGRWISADLVVQAEVWAGGVACRAADVIGLPETTFRRRREKAALNESTGMASRPDWWAEVRGLLAAILADKERPRDLFLVLQHLVLDEVSRATEGEVRTGAALVGVTPATYRRRLSEQQRLAG